MISSEDTSAIPRSFWRILAWVVLPAPGGPINRMSGPAAWTCAIQTKPRMHARPPVQPRIVGRTEEHLLLLLWREMIESLSYSRFYILVPVLHIANGVRAIGAPSQLRRARIHHVHHQNSIYVLFSGRHRPNRRRVPPYQPPHVSTTSG